MSKGCNGSNLIKLLQFTVKDCKIPQLGAVISDKPQIYVLSEPDVSNEHPMVNFLKSTKDALNCITNVISNKKTPTIKLQDVALLSPISGAGKIICIGPNYKATFDKDKKPYPKEPLVFNKYPSCIIGPCDEITLPKNSDQVEFEVELTAVIGKKAKDISEDQANCHIFGYTIGQDISARDWQRKRNHGQWLLGKAMDTFCPLGPYIVPQEFINPHDLKISTKVNEIVKQESNTCDLIFNVYTLVSYLSQTVTLLPGDVILTGSPPYNECHQPPIEYLKCGDLVTSEIENIGKMVNKCV